MTEASPHMSSPGAALIAKAAAALKARSAEVDRLNVFPVPDGDTGTNMSLTMDAVLEDLSSLPPTATPAEVCRAVTHGSLMGARGNSGVILSQILRGLCETISAADEIDTGVVADAFDRAVTVAFQAVRKPVEGTMLTVLRDSAHAAREQADAGTCIQEALQAVAAAAFDSVKRTPELLPVLKDNGVVDAGGFGLAILFEGFAAAVAGAEPVIADVSTAAAPLDHVQPVDDWDDDEYLYCTEFLLFGEDLDREQLLDFVVTMGGSELVVGDRTGMKIHVHTDDPGAVLTHMTALGEVAEVHINNMRRQTRARDEALRAEAEPAPGAGKRIGVVTVSVGEGIKEILTSLGADVIVNGGQTMNPSTKDILEAIDRVGSDSVVVLPNNKNIILTANAAAEAADRPVAVVPTSSIPEAFAALLALDDTASLEDAVASMTRATQRVRTGEVTTAVKDATGKVGRIAAGQVIGISDHEIEVVGDDVLDVTLRLAEQVTFDDAETMTVLAGQDLSDEDLATLRERLQAALPDIEIETHRGGQPLYPVLFGIE